MYQPLHVPSRPLESISMDFINAMPTALRKHDVIWVVVCRFSKMDLFIPCYKTRLATQTLDLFFQHVWHHFVFPSSIVYDGDSRFLSGFLHTLRP